MIAGDVEISEIAALLADRALCRVLLALNDGRALPASVLAGWVRRRERGRSVQVTPAGAAALAERLHIHWPP